MTNPLLAVLSNGRPLRGVLVRKVPVRMVELSLAGCLMETRVGLRPGSAGELSVNVDGHTHTDTIRVSRCVFVEGSGAVFRSGAEILWTRRPAARSLRAVAGKLQDQAPP